MNEMNENNKQDARMGIRSFIQLTLGMTKSIKTKAVIFDRDGVIINTEGVVIDSARKAFAKLGFTLLEDDIQHMIGRSSSIYTEYFLKKWDFDPDEYRKLHKEFFYSNIDSAPFFEDTIELIRSLYIKKIPVAVTTSAGKEGTLLILGKAGILQKIKIVVAKEDCTNLKPHPEPYIITAEKLGIAPEFCVVIEDTALGVESAKNAGMKCIAIPNEYTSDQDFSLADAVVESASEVEGILDFV
jgi:HAD superfamily hydrolase (TIGR01509 family)